MKPDVIGINCATGPAEMSEHLRHLAPARRASRSRACPTPACPSVVDGADALRPHAGAAGRAPRALRHRLRRRRRRRLLRHHARAHPPARRGGAATSSRPARTPAHEAGVTSIYSPVAVRAGHLSFLIIGERTNANGSKKFREAMLDGDWDTCVADGQGPGEGGRPRPRRLRRLRRPRRRRRHGRGRQALRHAVHACRSCSTPPSRR